MSILTQRTLAGGAVSPAIYARADTVKYQTGLRTQRNAFTLKHGGCANRPGFEYIGRAKDHAKTVRLVDFVFNTDQSYVLEFGDQTMRVIKNGAYITEAAKTITGFTAGVSDITFTSNSHGFSNGDEIRIAGTYSGSPISNWVNVTASTWIVSDVATNTFKIKFRDGSYFADPALSFVSNATASRVYTIATPYTEAMLSEIQWVQSADVVTIVHPDVTVRELARVADANWTLTAVTFAPSISAPTGLAVSGTAGTVVYWVVTSVASETYEESLASSSVGANAEPSTGSPRTLTWTQNASAVEYNVYRSVNGVFSFVGVAPQAASPTFIDNGLTPDTTDTPPTARNPFNATGDYPSTVTYIQQRLTFGATDNSPEKVWMSRSAQFKNFTISSPLQDDDAVTFEMVGRQVNAIKHIVDLGKPVAFTSSGEWSINGDTEGVIKPTAINPKQYSYNGATSLRPLVINGNALYIQARGNVVRDLAFDYTVDGYRGNDLTRFAFHFFEKYTIVDWAYQQIPHSVVWAVRDDGKLLSLTYIREEQIFAWAEHDTEGTIENVCVIPEGDEDAVYVCVKRYIDGEYVRYIERMATRKIYDVKDMKFMDSYLTYDGRNTNTAITMTLSGGSTWEYTETLTITRSSAWANTAQWGDEIQLVGSDGTLIRFTIDGVTSTTVATGRANKTVPSAMRSVAISDWAVAVDTIVGLWHIENENVSVLGDGLVVASPNNDSYVTQLVTEGALTFDRPYSVIHIGLPYLTDIETLNIEVADGSTMADKYKNISEVIFQFEDTRGVFAGPKPPTDDATDPLENLYEMKIRDLEGYDDPTSLVTDSASVQIMPEWNSNGRVFIRQVDPLPMTILAISPSGLIPLQRRTK